MTDSVSHAVSWSLPAAPTSRSRPHLAAAALGRRAEPLLAPAHPLLATDRAAGVLVDLAERSRLAFLGTGKAAPNCSSVISSRPPVACSKLELLVAGRGLYGADHAVAVGVAGRLLGARGSVVSARPTPPQKSQSAQSAIDLHREPPCCAGCRRRARPPAGAVPGARPAPALRRRRHSRKGGWLRAHFAVDKHRGRCPIASECVTMSQSDAKRCGGARYPMTKRPRKAEIAMREAAIHSPPRPRRQRLSAGRTPRPSRHRRVIARPAQQLRASPESRSLTAMRRTAVADPNIDGEVTSDRGGGATTRPGSGCSMGIGTAGSTAPSSCVRSSAPGRPAAASRRRGRGRASKSVDWTAAASSPGGARARRAMQRPVERRGSARRVQAMFEAVDADRDGALSKGEFIERRRAASSTAATPTATARSASGSSTAARACSTPPASLLSGPGPVAPHLAHRKGRESARARARARGRQRGAARCGPISGVPVGQRSRRG